ncbi:MAG: nitroreductase family protein [Trueperaceae bacterium]|nr:MAG: nitroreductase family protein [Trueperaceae bacterium]
MELTETIETILAHRSVRTYRSESLSEAHLQLLTEAMRRGPSSSALQNYTVILITEQDLKEQLARLCGNQAYIAQCPLFIVTCVDLRRVEKAALARDYPYRASDLRILLSATEDVAIAVQNASLAAQSLGLATVMIGGVMNGSREIAALLGLPPRVAPLLGLCVGYSDEDPKVIPPRPRLPKEVVFHRERYQLSEREEERLLDRHDQEVISSGFYHARHIPFDELFPAASVDPVGPDGYGWTEHVARKQARLWWEGATEKLWEDFEAMGLRLRRE